MPNSDTVSCAAFVKSWRLQCSKMHAGMPVAMVEMVRMDIAVLKAVT